MILIQVNNQDARSNFQLLERIEKWAKENIKGEYVIVLDPNIEGEIKITNQPDTSPQANKGGE